MILLAPLPKSNPTQQPLPPVLDGASKNVVKSQSITSSRTSPPLFHEPSVPTIVPPSWLGLNVRLAAPPTETSASAGIKPAGRFVKLTRTQLMLLPKLPTERRVRSVLVVSDRFIAR